MSRVIELTREFRKNHLARSIPGARFDPDTRAWVIDLETATPAARIVIVKLFPELAHQVDVASAAVDIRPIDLASGWFADHGEPALEGLSARVREAMSTRPYQLTDVAYLAARLRADGGAYNGWDRGLGKTIAALAQIELAGADRAIVVTPRRSIGTVWEPEIERWYPGLPHHRVGSTASKRKRAVDAWQSDGGILLCHYEALRLIDWSRATVDMVVVDEAHRLANGGPPQSSRVPAFYKALKAIDTPNRLAMSGSIVVNGAEDLFGALYWLFPQVYRSRWRDWLNRYMVIVDTPNGKINAGVKPELIDALRHELAAFMVVRNKDDELAELPERIRVLHRVELSTPQRKAYDDLAERYYTELEDGTPVTAASVVAKLTRLRQVATGLDLVSETIQESTKLDYVEELVRDNLPNKTVVFAWHRATVDALVARLADLDAVGAHGGYSERETEDAVKTFQTDPAVKVIVATIKTLGESVTLTAAADVVFVEHSWTAADMEQAADRVRRIGQTRRVTLTEVVAADTIDEQLVLPTVKTKAEIRRLLFGGLA